MSYVSNLAGTHLDTQYKDILVHLFHTINIFLIFSVIF